MNRILLVLGITVPTILFPGAAHASCVPPPPLRESLEDAAVVFVGTVQATSNLNRNATVTVESVWKGGRLPLVVEIQGGAQGSNVAGSNDRSYEEDVRYLFVLRNDEEPFRDDACTVTQRYQPSLNRFAPEQADGDVPFDDLDDSPHRLTIVLSVLAVSAAAFLVLRAFRGRSG